MAKGFKGWACLQKTAGAGPLSVGTQINLPATYVLPINPLNRERPMTINGSADPNIEIDGFYTPMVQMTSIARVGWFTAALLNSLLRSWDSNDDSDEFAIGLYNGSSWRVYDGCHCQMLLLSGKKSLDPVQMMFKSLYPESLKPGGATSFATPTTQSGQAIKASQVDWSATAADVREWAIAMNRQNDWDPTANGTRFARAVESGPFYGAVALTQREEASTTVDSTDTVSGTATIKLGSVGAGVQIACKVSNDGDSKALFPGITSKARAYSFIDLAGGAAVSITAM